MNSMKHMLRVVMLFVVTSGAVGAVQPSYPPFTPEQVVQVRALVERTQANQKQLKAALVEAQEKLAGCYSGFELNDDRIALVHREIAGLQQKLLDSHYSMQKELRKIVAPDQFEGLTRRIAGALGTPSPPTQK